MLPHLSRQTQDTSYSRPVIKDAIGRAMLGKVPQLELFAVDLRPHERHSC